MRTPLALQLHSLREEDTANPGGKLRRIRALGYQAIELAGSYGMPAREWKSILEETGLAVVGAHVPLDALTARFDEEADFHAAIGNRRIVVPTLPPEYRVLDGFVRAAELLGRLGQRLADRGLELLYHNHGYEFHEFDDGRTGMDVLFGGTDADRVGFEIDVGWVETAGADPADFLRENATRVRALHLKEIRHRDGALVPIGQGDVDFAAIIPLALHRHWPMIVEYEGGAASSAVKMSADHLRHLMEAIT
ncbi:MAG TPA: sugar phosphate isomerase/epimerase [Verrucomicrobiae bacterium]|nr:sugar phosphate isomerase/epimerase [Verrucomicrobiae bacterium]